MTAVRERSWGREGKGREGVRGSCIEEEEFGKRKMGREGMRGGCCSEGRIDGEEDESWRRTTISND